jgi:hypothetical protein
VHLTCWVAFSIAPPTFVQGPPSATSTPSPPPPSATPTLGPSASLGRTSPSALPSAPPAASTSATPAPTRTSALTGGDLTHPTGSSRGGPAVSVVAGATVALATIAIGAGYFLWAKLLRGSRVEARKRAPPGKASAGYRQTAAGVEAGPKPGRSWLDRLAGLGAGPPSVPPASPHADTEGSTGSAPVKVSSRYPFTKCRAIHSASSAYQPSTRVVDPLDVASANYGNLLCHAFRSTWRGLPSAQGHQLLVGLPWSWHGSRYLIMLPQVCKGTRLQGRHATTQATPVLDQAGATRTLFAFPRTHRRGL